MRIYVACLAAYNNGWLHGKWIDCEGKDAEAIREETQLMLKESPVTKEYGEIAEEWAIHDYEGFGSYKVKEWSSFDEIGAIARAVENSEHDLELITGVMDQRGCTAENAIEYIDDNYSGEFKDLISYAWDFLESVGDFSAIPKHLQGYFDIEAYARDFELNGDIFTVDSANGIYVLWNH